MNPIVFAVITFGIWIIVKGEASTYWALATTPNPAGSVLAPSQGTSGAAGSPQSMPAAPAPAVVAQLPQAFGQQFGLTAQ